MNGHGWWMALAIGAASFAAGVIWSLHTNDAAQTQRLDEFERRADVARGVLHDGLERLADLERKVALLEQRVEAMP